MKKLILLFLLVSGFALSSNVQAQDYNSAIGLRFGYPLSLSYKTFLNEKNALDLFLGYRSYSGIYNYLALGGFYEFHNDINGVEGLNWYYGFGASIIFIGYDDIPYLNDQGKFGVGLSGIIGLEYTFEDAPVCLSIDFAPTFRIGGWDDGYYSWGALSARYILNR
jgi:hypothetical protein